MQVAQRRHVKLTFDSKWPSGSVIALELFDTGTKSRSQEFLNGRMRALKQD
jgi:hypothetical protein